MLFDRRWLLPALGFVIVQHIIAFLLAARMGLDQRPPFYEYGVLYFRAILLVVAIVLIVLFGRAIAAKSVRPVGYVWRSVREFSPRFAEVIPALLLSWLQLVALTWYKSMIPLTGPMWADPILADVDQILFGSDPGPAIQAEMAHFASLIDTFYMLWAPVLKLCFLCVLLMPQSRNRSIALLSYFLTIGLLGSWGQFVLPSGGPIFWEHLGYGDRFAGIQPPPLAAATRDYLWLKYVGNSPDFASGISAFPSIHVATSAWMIIAAWLCMPAARTVSTVYFAITAVGSVYTGWHYGLDGIAGAAGALACFALARSLVSRSTGSEAENAFGAGGRAGLIVSRDEGVPQTLGDNGTG